MFDWKKFEAAGSAFEVCRGDAVTFLKSLPDDCVDAFVTDAPYGIDLKLGTNHRGRNSIAGDGRVEAWKLWRRWVPEAARVAKPDTSHLFFGTWKSPWMYEVLAEHFLVKGSIVWNKRTFGLGHYLRPQWEQIYFCVKGKPPRRGVAPSDVWEIPRILRPQHPCEKPVPLLRRAIGLVSDPGQTICDPFCGIGAAVVAAVLEGRRCIASEIDPSYAQLTIARARDALKGTDNAS